MHEPVENFRRPLAIFLATSGHSGVDRVMGNLIRELGRREFPFDLIKIRSHGPYISEDIPSMRLIELPVSHVNGALIPLIRYLRKERPTVLLTDKDRVNRIALLASRLSGAGTRVGIRVGTTVSVNLAHRGWFHRKMQYLSIRHIYPWSECIIVPSQGAAQDIAQVGHLPHELIKVLPSPVAGDHVERLARQWIDHPWLEDLSTPIILGAGELCGRKDFETLIRAFSIVLKRKTCRLIIIGEGRKRNSLERLVKTLGLEQHISMPGFVYNPYAFMKRASVFVLSSKCEGAPVVLMEALALGIPVVSTDCPSGPREILMNGRVGPLVPVADPQSMAEAILSVLDNPPDQELLKSAARPYSIIEATNRYLQALGLIDV